MEIRRRISIILSLFLLALTQPGALWAYEVQGRVALEAPYPEVKKIPVKEKYQEMCSREVVSQALLFSPKGHLKNAVVWLEGDLKGEFPNRTAQDLVLDQKQCNFDPHILIVPQGKPFQIANSDPMAHDVRAFEEAKMLFRFEMDAFEKPVEKSFEKPDIYVLRCGLHHWMHAFVVSAEHPYYSVSDENGEFRFTKVPPGRYNLHIWHETLGEGQTPVEVTEKDVRGISYTFKLV